MKSHLYHSIGKIEGRKGNGQQRMGWLESITDLMNISLNKPWEVVEDRGAWHAVVHGISNSRT